MPIVIAGSIRVPAAYRAHLLEASQPYQVASRVEVAVSIIFGASIQRMMR